MDKQTEEKIIKELCQSIADDLDIYNFKSCTICNITKPLNKFNTSKNNNKLYYNKKCRRCEVNLRKFGINDKQYQDMLKLQNNKCKICNNDCDTHKTLSIDHCHKTGKVRGLLCNHCNTALGKFKDNIKYLENAINYLKGEKYDNTKK